MTEPEFSVLTWNVLAQAYVKPERYRNSDPDALAAEPRTQRLLDQIEGHDADVLCLQELQPDVLQAVLHRLPDHASCYGQKHEKPDGSAVLVRRSAFTLESHEVLHFDAVEPGYDHVAVVARLQSSTRRLGVVSTHLRWQRRDTPAHTHLGRLQLLEVLDHIEPLRGEWPAWVICGDFNTLSESVVVQAALDRGFRLSCRSQRPWDTVNIDGRRRKLDYLLVDPEHLRPHPGVLPQLQRDTPMPSAEHPSDHLPVLVRYSWV